MDAIFPTEKCFACGACSDICPPKAISFKKNKHGYLYPNVDTQKCISCGACSRVCIIDKKEPLSQSMPVAYISRADDKERYELSASGGIFGIIASEFLKTNGIVYGAAMTKIEGHIQCKHIRIDSLDELYKIQGSKYVHSETVGVFSDVLRDLRDGNRVLFSGTSCQVDALKSYLGKTYNSLFTVDLVCHGVPTISLLQEYIDYIQKKDKCCIDDISFRRKTIPGFGLNKDSYVLTLTGQKNNEQFEKYISRKNSGYYNLFLSRAGYRPNCYSCPYATINKKGDITLGDFVPKGTEYEKYQLSSNYMYSTVLINNSHGESLFSTVSSHCISKEIDIDTVLMHHRNLSKPSKCSRNGEIMLSLYDKLGFAGLEKYIFVRNKLKEFYHLIKK